MAASKQFRTSSAWQSPSNIALVKYWGKKGFQLPSNASISFTLSECHTSTKLEWTKRNDGDQEITVYVDGHINIGFVPKVRQFFENISEIYPIISDYNFEVHTFNTFPHSSGIASSASGMSALALCTVDLLESNGTDVDNPLQLASNLARIGSGSASRSIYRRIAMWGEHEDFAGSSDEYAIPVENIHKVFHTFEDTILIVHEGAKEVSSTAGHGLLKNHPLAEKRFKIANENMTKMKEILVNGNLDDFVELVENEALMLHSLMMTSKPSFILMKPQTLEIIDRIRKSRQKFNHHICFTLDAGANVHMLYPAKDRALANKLINDELVDYCENGRYIRDMVGQGPKRIDA